MNLSKFFIDRPIFAGVLSLIILVMGLLALKVLPISEYPEVVPPQVVVRAVYPGASPAVIAETVAAPIEESVNGVENMLYMSSQATTDGTMTLTVTFKLGTNADLAQQMVQNRVSQAEARLPDDVRTLGVTTEKSQSSLPMVVHIVSPNGRYDVNYLRNYALIHIKDRLQAVKGVGPIQMFGGGDYAMRIWLDPQKVAERGLSAGDIANAIRSENVQAAAGSVGASPGLPSNVLQMSVNAEGRLKTEDDFRDIIVKTGADGSVTRLGDVARVEMGASDYSLRSLLDGKAAVGIPIFETAGANSLQLAHDVRATMAELKKSMPEGVDYRIAYDTTEYVQESIDSVIHTLLEAILLVVIVVILFLQTWRASIIPLLSVPVSIIGTFAVMQLFGFTINTLTLFGLVLAIGIVVDDAIVVVENVERHLEHGMSPAEAAHTTMDEVGGALIAIALVLASVFVPAAFIPGISGQFYRQFALTIASATVISLIVSLTLSPAMAALILRPKRKAGEAPSGPAWTHPFAKFADAFDHGFNRPAGGYGGLTRRFLRLATLMIVVYVGLILLTGWRIMATPIGFIPPQDQGNVIMAANLPSGSSLSRTDAAIRKTIPYALKVAGIIGASSYAGVDATSQTTNSASGQAYLIESDFADRAKHHVTLKSMIAELQKTLGQIPDAQIRILPPPPVRGIGTQGGAKMIVEDRTGKADYPAIEQAAKALVAAFNKDPDISDAYETFTTDTPRIHADIDREKAEYYGVVDSSVFDTLQTFLGSSFINDFNYLNHTYQVYAQADAPFRQDLSAIQQLQTRSASGAMMPLGAVVNLTRTTGPYRVLRYQLYPSAEVQANTPVGRSTGQTMAAMEKIAAKTLPNGFQFEWTELAYQQQAAGNTAGLVFVLAVILVFLLLAALYESVTMPLAVILIVPMCLLAAITGVNIMGMDNNILTQVGFIVLIGLAAKNAILIVEFARQGELEHGHSRADAASEAAQTRLRPILMTSFAFILGVVPLAFAHGAGAELRQALGVAVFFGMIGVTIFGLAFTPVFYVVTRALSDRIPQPPTSISKKQKAGEAPEDPNAEQVL